MAAGVVKQAKRMRRMRVLMVCLGAINAAAFVLNLIAASFLALLPGFLVLACATLVVLQTRHINGREVASRRPDYAAIARMEREVWGESFEPHADERQATSVPAPLAEGEVAPGPGMSVYVGTRGGGRALRTLGASSPSQPRLDLVCRTPGGVTVIQGSPAPHPVAPAVPAQAVRYAVVRVPPGSTTMQDCFLVAFD